eukprot:886709-Pleurochrysis_carterae.AAC.5
MKRLANVAIALGGGRRLSACKGRETWGRKSLGRRGEEAWKRALGAGLRSAHHLLDGALAPFGVAARHVERLERRARVVLVPARPSKRCREGTRKTPRKTHALWREREGARAVGDGTKQGGADRSWAEEQAGEWPGCIVTTLRRQGPPFLEEERGVRGGLTRRAGPGSSRGPARAQPSTTCARPARRQRSTARSAHTLTAPRRQELEKRR